MTLATSMAASGPSTTTAKPASASVASMWARRGLAATIRPTASSTAARTSSSQQISQARPSGPCSACSTMSTATSSTLAAPSATTTTSDGPAKLDGTPTSPLDATSRLACATRALPGPTMTSTGRIDSVP